MQWDLGHGHGVLRSKHAASLPPGLGLRLEAQLNCTACSEVFKDPRHMQAGMHAVPSVFAFFLLYRFPEARTPVAAPGWVVTYTHPWIEDYM